MIQSAAIIFIPFFVITTTLFFVNKNPRIFNKYGLIIGAFELFGVLCIMTVAAAILRKPVQGMLNAIAIFKAIATFMWFGAEFLILLLFVNLKQKSLRISFIRASLYYSVFIWSVTELLSLFYFLNFFGSICCHIVYDIIILVLFFTRRKKSNLEIRNIFIIPFKWIYCFPAVILCVTFFIAFVSPPNNWDSMTYHLPRIEHWIQNKSLRHYSTSIVRQLISAPFAEMSILQGRIISGDNWLMNMEQWLSFAGIAVGISLIAGHLGLNKRVQTAASLFFLTIPMAILQSSSTQTDLVEAFYIICMAERFLAWKRDATLHNSIEFGIALGLCILTKGTAYPIAFAFVCYFAIISVKRFKTRLFFAFAAATICLVLNMPHYIRNQTYFGNPLSPPHGTVSNFTVKQFVFSFFFNLYSNIPFPLPKIDSKINEYLVSQDARIFPYGPGQILGIKASIKSFLIFNEDIAGNGFHLLLIIVSFVLILPGKSKLRYPWIVLFSWLTFFYFIPWQPWITRLQVPLFALSAPVFALAFAETKKRGIFNRAGKICLVFLCCFALLPLFKNSSRPLLYIPGLAKNTKLIWNTSRLELIFHHKPDIYSNYIAACETISKERANDIGIIIGGDSWEYPLWFYMDHFALNMPNITHQNIESVDENVGILFILERNDVPFISDTQKAQLDYPYVLKRNFNSWNVLYAPE
jgi:hypothetical protein